MGKRYGQHFLRSHAVLEKIAAAAEIAGAEPVLEIGPGEGALTELLLRAGAKLVAVEIDPDLAASLRQRFGERLRIVEGDILKTALEPEALFGQAAPYAVIANLPYYLSTPLLFRLIAARRHLSRLVLMLQREVAERIVAGPQDGKDYGSLSIAAQHAFSVQRLFTVPPGAFRPPPKVDSAVVRLVPREPLLTEAAEAAFFEHVKRLFTRRRKLMLPGLLKERPELTDAQRGELDRMIGTRRAEALTPEEHLEVFRVVSGS
jgi:16S rRNA (adenine1518-N6/adenine1519-N6)-dimethyltransferase